MFKVKQLGRNADALLNLGLCWFCLSLIAFSSDHLFFFKHMIQNTSAVPISMETGSDNTAIKERVKC